MCVTKRTKFNFGSMSQMERINAI